MGDQQQTQLTRSVEVAKERLADLVTQRDELNAAIADLTEQLKWGEEMVASMRDRRDAAE